MALNTKLDIHIQVQKGRSVLKNGYTTPPFKIADITQDRDQKRLDLMLMCSSPGMLSDDTYDFNIYLEENAELQLKSQSYQRIFNMAGTAKQNIYVKLGVQAVFHYLPHPVVPHRNSRFISSTNIFLNKGSELLWGEIITGGRMIHDELFQMKEYRSAAKVFYENRLMIFENIWMQPSINDPMELGLLEGYTHQASLLYWNDQHDISLIADNLYAYFSTSLNISFGVSTTQGHGMIVRILGFKAEVLYQYLHDIQKMINQYKSDLVYVS